MDNGIIPHPGRPELTKFELESAIRKLAPFLQRGISVKEACLQTGIPASTVYKKMQEVEWFKNEVERAQQFFFVAYSDAIFREFMKIYTKILNQIELTGQEHRFLCWLGENDRRLSEMYGKHNWRDWLKAEEEERGEMQILRDPQTLESVIEFWRVIIKNWDEERELEQSSNNQKQIDGETYNAL